jgi:acyl carrier protein
MDEKIREIIGKHARVTTPADALDGDTDLYAAGMTSQASVNLMLALEDAFDVEFPDRMLTRAVFSSIASIRSALTELQGSTAA